MHGEAIVERLTDGDEAGPTVEVQRAVASMAPDERALMTDRMIDEGIEDLAAEPLATPAFFGGHPPDPPRIRAIRLPRGWVGKRRADGDDFGGPAIAQDAYGDVGAKGVVVTLEPCRVPGKTRTEHFVTEQSSDLGVDDIDRHGCVETAHGQSW